MLQIIIIALIVAADQITKNLIVPMLQNLPDPQSITVIPNVFNLTYVKNNGASFGIFSGAQVFFIVLTIIILVFGTYFMIKTRHKQSLFLKICLSLLVGGAIGNFIDRVSFGYVRDIFDFSHLYFPWVFNVADACLVVGAILLGIYVLFIYKGKDEKKENTEDKQDIEDKEGVDDREAEGQ